MTETPRPVPGPPRPAAVPAAGQAGSGEDSVDVAARLASRPVAEHAAVLEAEHDRLQRRLATIDQL